MSEQLSEFQIDDVVVPETPRTADDDILDEAFNLLSVSDEDESPASRSDVEGTDADKSESESTSGQAPDAGRSNQNTGNKHSVQNRINFFKRLAAEADERADAFRLQSEGLQRENESLQKQVKQLETLLDDLQEQQRNLMRGGFDFGATDPDFQQSGGIQSPNARNNAPKRYAEDDENRPLTHADWKKLREQEQKQTENDQRFSTLLKGWLPHLDKAKKQKNADVVDATFKNFLRDAKGRPGMVHAVEMIKDLEHPIETLTALTCLPGYKNMTPAQIAANVTRLNNGLITRKNAITQAKPIRELKGGAAPKQREPQSYDEYRASLART